MPTCQLGSRDLVIQMPILCNLDNPCCWQARKATESSLCLPSEHQESSEEEQEEKGRRWRRRERTRKCNITASVWSFPRDPLVLKDTGGWHDQRNEQLAADNRNATRVCVLYTTAALRRLSLSPKQTLLPASRHC